MILICMRMKLHAELSFVMKGFALRLVLKQRHKRNRKWPIIIDIVDKSKSNVV